MAKVTKISKTGYGQQVGSSFGFGSWAVPATSIELEGEWDLSTEEGRAKYEKAMAVLRKLTMDQLQQDIEYFKSVDPEFAASVENRKAMVANHNSGLSQ